MGTFTLIHMERPDPWVLTRREFWRARVQFGPGGEDKVMIEEGTIGGSHSCIEVPRDDKNVEGVIGQLGALIDQKVADGWEVVMHSSDVRRPDEDHEYTLFQFKVKPGFEQRDVVVKILSAMDVNASMDVDWITHKNIEQMMEGVSPNRWDVELQVGFDRLKLSTGARTKVVLSARVPLKSVAAEFLLTLASSTIGLDPVVTDDNGRLLEAADINRALLGVPAWVDDVGLKLGVNVVMGRAGSVPVAPDSLIRPVIF